MEAHPGSGGRPVVAVIGNGASGTLACAQLLRQAGTRALQIEWIGAEETFGPGLPYRTQDPDHRLNVRAAGMSAFPDEPLHFARWAGQRNPSLTEQSFAPRGLYGEYLQSLVPQDPRIRRHTGEVVALDFASGRYLLSLRDGRRLTANQVVLALGILPAAPAFGAEPPWRAVAIPESARVLILGTGLTMVDVALTLCRRPAQAPVHALSKHGLLPQVHKTYSTHSPSPAFTRWLAAPGTPLGESLRLFRAECSAAGCSGSDWRAVFDRVRPHTGRIWQRLSLEDRQRFLRHAVRYWDIHRHRMAPEIAQKIERYRQEGRLLVEAGRVKRLERTPTGWQVTWIAGGRELMQEFDHVIDCTGLSRRVRESSSPLVQDLIRKRILQVDEPPLGAHLTGIYPGLYCLGPLLRGALWESIAIPELRMQAQEIGQRILADLTRSSESRELTHSRSESVRF